MDKLKHITINGLIDVLVELVEKEGMKGTDEVWLSEDEEGNSFSGLVDELISVDKKSHRVFFYPYTKEEL